MHLQQARFALVAAGVASLMAASAMGAQEVAAPAPAGPGTIVGVVTDSASRPIGDVEIRMGRLNRIARTAPNGTFRFDSVPAGRHELRARRVGYEARSRNVTVGDGGGTVTFVLKSIPQLLPTVVTAVPRGGLGGVVTDEKLQGLAEAEVRVFGGSERTQTDASGEFFMDVRPGSYMVRVTKPGRAPRLLSVTIPNDSGRRISVPLHPGGRGSNMEELGIQNLARRLAWRVSPSRFFSRDDMTAMGARSVIEVARRNVSHPLDEACMAVVDGGPDQMPLWYFDADEIEGMEIYPGNSLRIIIGGDRQRAMAFGQGERMGAIRGCPLVYVWLR